MQRQPEKMRCGNVLIREMKIEHRLEHSESEGAAIDRMQKNSVDEALRLKNVRDK